MANYEPSRKRMKGDGKHRDITGGWVLCRDRSESMMPYLRFGRKDVCPKFGGMIFLLLCRLMGLNEMAIDAWIKAEKETDTYKVIEFVAGASRASSGVRIRKVVVSF
jgi:hypothetical protein